MSELRCASLLVELDAHCEFVEHPSVCSEIRQSRIMLDKCREELGHVLMHEPSLDIAENCRGHREVEAETFAALICELAGLDTCGYSVPYVASWSQQLVNDETDIVSVLIKHTQRVLDVVDTVIGPLLETQNDSDVTP
jgi:hypothetical protein